MYCCTCKERAVSGHGKVGVRNVRKKMVVLPNIRSVAQIRFREGGGQGRGKQKVGMSGVGDGVGVGKGSW